MGDGKPIITGLQDGFISLKRKGDGWRPDAKGRASIENLGYVFGETLGEGEAAKVKKAFHTIDKSYVAVKIIKKCKLSEDVLKKFVQREISILQEIQHPGIVEIHEVFESPRCIYLVTEYVPNGDLFSFVAQLGNLSEADARRLFHQLLDIVHFLHEKNICHRDIKLDNLLLDEFYNLKLIDFGFARYLPKNRMIGTTCGSYVYTAPEVLDGEGYDGIKADIWSMGVCLYAMLCGKLPFRDDDVDVLRYSMHQKLKFYKYVSKDCRDLLRSLLDSQPTSRPSISDIRRTEWMCRPLKASGESSMSSMSVAAVMSTSHQAAILDPDTEHGFTCDTHNHKFKSSRVSDVLRSVAENHSTGRSSIDLTKTATKQASSIAMATGVSGPVGRKISQQLGLNTEFNEPENSTNQAQHGNKMMPESSNKAKFGKAFKAMKTFRTAATVVKAVRRFKHKQVLHTILNMPQEEAMQKVLHKNQKQIKSETYELHRCSSGKVALVCGDEKRRVAQLKKERSLMLCEEKQKQENKREMFDSTMCYLLPDEYD